MKTLKTKFDYFESFSSLADFKAGLERPRTGKFAEAHSSDKKDYWSGTETFEEAESLMANGYDVGAEKLMKKVLAIHNTAPKARMIASVSGSAPIVANAIIGYPRSMWTTKQMPKPSPTRKVFIVNTAGHAVNSDELLESGAVMLNVCNQLEMNGVRTEIISIPKFSYTVNKNRQTFTGGCSIKLKDYRETFSFKKMAYPIAHTSAFRRHGFKWLETCGADVTFKNRFSSTYGISYAREQKQTVEKLQALGLAGKNDVVMTYGLVAGCGFKLDKVMQELGLNQISK